VGIAGLLLLNDVWSYVYVSILSIGVNPALLRVVDK